MYRGVGADFEKPKKYFRLIMNRVPLNVEKSGFQKNFEKNDLEGRAPASELLLQRGSLPSQIALQGGSLQSKMVYRGVGADFEKPKKYFRLIMKKICLENFKSLYTNKKVQLQLDFFDKSSCSWTF